MSSPLPGMLRSAPRALLILLAMALALRAVLVPYFLVHQADEVWQYLEPAYGLVTGRWITAWEFHAGIRTWLLPVIFAVPVGAAHLVAPYTDLHLWLVRALLAVCSLGVVAAFWGLARPFGKPHAIIAAFVGAVWFELVYFASSALSDAIALWLVMPAVWALSRARADRSWRMAALGGLLLGFTFAVRFQLAPVLLLFAIWGCGLRWKTGWGPLILGCLVAAAADGLADLATGNTPFLWIWRNLVINLVEDKASSFGVEPWWWYPWRLVKTWGLPTTPIVLLALVGARRFPVFLAAAILVVAFHSTIPHKEYRFVVLASVLVAFLAAVGTGDLVAWIARRWRTHDPRTTTRLVAGACVFWFAFSVYGGASKPFRGYWNAGRNNLTAMQEAARTPGMCAIAVYQSHALPDASYTYVNRPVPIYLFQGPDAQRDALANAQAFNVVVGSRLAGERLEGYSLTRCTQKPKRFRMQAHCVFVREGGCTGEAPDFAYNKVLTALGR